MSKKHKVVDQVITSLIEADTSAESAFEYVLDLYEEALKKLPVKYQKKILKRITSVFESESECDDE